MARQKQYDLSVPMLDSADMPISAHVLRIPPIAEDLNDDETPTEAYLKGPCPIWKAIRFACQFQDVERNADGAPIKQKPMSEKEKGERYEICSEIMHCYKRGQVDQVPLTEDEVKLIKQCVHTCFGVEPYGIVVTALKHPKDPSTVDGQS